MSDAKNQALTPLTQLREVLNKARDADDAERIHAALIEVVDGLLSRAEHFQRFMDSVRSDLDHKQGIVSNIGGGQFVDGQDNDPAGRHDT